MERKITFPEVFSGFNNRFITHTKKEDKLFKIHFIKS